jgi:hypothetical protein
MNAQIDTSEQAVAVITVSARTVIPAQAGIQECLVDNHTMDPRLRGDDVFLLDGGCN